MDQQKNSNRFSFWGVFLFWFVVIFLGFILSFSSVFLHPAEGTSNVEGLFGLAIPSFLIAIIITFLNKWFIEKKNGSSVYPNRGQTEKNFQFLPFRGVSFLVVIFLLFYPLFLAINGLSLFSAGNLRILIICILVLLRNRIFIFLSEVGFRIPKNIFFEASFFFVFCFLGSFVLFVPGLGDFMYSHALIAKFLSIFFFWSPGYYLLYIIALHEYGIFLNGKPDRVPSYVVMRSERFLFCEGLYLVLWVISFYFVEIIDFLYLQILLFSIVFTFLQPFLYIVWVFIRSNPSSFQSRDISEIKG